MGEGKTQNIEILNVLKFSCHLVLICCLMSEFVPVPVLRYFSLNGRRGEVVNLIMPVPFSSSEMLSFEGAKT